jgi:hypothetical protein
MCQNISMEMKKKTFLEFCNFGSCIFFLLVRQTRFHSKIRHFDATPQSKTSHDFRSRSQNNVIGHIYRRKFSPLISIHFFKTTSFSTDLVFCILLLHPLVKTETLTSTSKTFLLHISNSLRTSMHPIDNLSRIT